MRSRERRAFSSRCAIAMARGWPWFSAIMPRAASARITPASGASTATSGQGRGRPSISTTNRQRLAWFHEYYRSHLASISHLVLYNSGSVLNPREMPPELLDEILAFARSLPAVRSSRSIRASLTSGRNISDGFS